MLVTPVELLCGVFCFFWFCLFFCGAGVKKTKKKKKKNTKQNKNTQQIIRACREMGIRCVAVYSTADRHALHVQLADQAVCIGKPAARDSYLKANALLTAARITGCDAVHPGFGFLSEDADFARQCREAGLIFVGPSPEAITLLGDKARAKQTMQAAGVPVIPGSDGIVADLASAKEIAAKIGYPLLIKASAGGGGRGIRPVYREEELESQMRTASEEAASCFG